jgi:membrane protein
MVRMDKKILESEFFRRLAEKTKRIILPGFNRVPLYDVGSFFFKQIKKVGLNDRARSISFSFLSAIPAATLFLCTLIPLLPVSKKINRQLLLITQDITPNQNTYLMVRNFLEDFLNKPHGGLLSIGFFLTLFYASNAMIGVMRSFNKSLIYYSRQNMFETRWMAIKLTILLVVLVIASVMLMVTQNELLLTFLKWMHIKGRSAKWLFKTLRWIVIIPLFYYSIGFIYKYGPSMQKRWKISSPGTLLATTLILVSTFLFSYWVNKFGTYNKIYGSIGTILILMLLIYFNALFILIGFELNVSIHHLRETAQERQLEEEQRNASLA